MNGEWVTQREASAHLDCVAPTQARRALACGVAGPARRDGQRLLYRLADVREVAAREPVGADTLAALGPLGAMVIRVPSTVPAPTIQFDLDCWLIGPWQPSLPVSLLMEAVLENSALPVIVTVSGFVVACRELVRTSRDSIGVRFDCAPAGVWREAVLKRRWPQRGGGPPVRYVQIGPGAPRYFC